MITILDAILAINPNAQVKVGGNDVNDITWLNETAVISKTNIEAKVTELETAYNNNKYQRDRVYPSIQEQLDMQYWDSVNGTTTWKDAVAKVKADNPKPE
jgi:hypothetical protein